MRPYRPASIKRLMPFRLQNCVKVESRRIRRFVKPPPPPQTPPVVPGENHANDFTSFFVAELTDALFPALNEPSGISRSESASPSSSNILNTAHRPAVQPPARSILNAANSALWLPIFSALHERGALTAADYASIRRHLPAPVFHTLLPWVWQSKEGPVFDNFIGEREDGNVEGAFPGKGSLGTSLEGTSFGAFAMSGSIDDLRVLPPARWQSIIRTIRGPGVNQAEEGGSKERKGGKASLGSPGGKDSSSPLEIIQRWHDALFALSTNPSFSGSSDAFKEAHQELLEVVKEFYRNAEKLQMHLTLPPVNVKKESNKVGETQKEGTSFERIECTRMPPVLVRRWRARYNAHHAIMLYAELFRAIVEGEEAVVRVMKAQQRAEREAFRSNGAEGPSGSGPSPCTTAFLQDEALWLHFLSIPGRRTSGLAWRAQWASTKAGALVYFCWHFRQLLECAARDRDPALPERLFVDLQKACSILMNVCVWVRNDNDEGRRFAEAARVVLEAFLDACAASPSGLFAESVIYSPEDGLFPRVLSLVQRTAVEAMLAKAEQLHFAASAGLFDVCTVVAALEPLKPDRIPEPLLRENDDEDGKRETDGDDGAYSLPFYEITRRKVRDLLHSGRQPWRAGWSGALASRPGAGLAARYALLSLGRRLILRLAAARIPSRHLSRVVEGLFSWGWRIARPLGLSPRTVEALWFGLVKLSAPPRAADANDNPENPNAALIYRWETFFAARLLCRESDSAPPLPLTRSEGWTCGCGFTTQTMQIAAKADAQSLSALPIDSSTIPTACAACVCRHLVPECWQCPSCAALALTGERTLHCLNCGAAHPSRAKKSETTMPTARKSKAYPNCRINNRKGGNAEDRDGVYAENYPTNEEGAVGCDHRHLANAVFFPTNRGGKWASCPDCGEIIQIEIQTRKRGGGDAFLPSDGGEMAAKAGYSAPAPMLSGCRRCHHYHVVDGRARAEEGVVCGSCGNAEGEGGVYVRGYFTWRCGCGAMNDPTRTHCWACTHAARKARALDPTRARLTAMGAIYQCPDCQNAVPIAHAARQLGRLAEADLWGANRIPNGDAMPDAIHDDASHDSESPRDPVNDGAVRAGGCSHCGRPHPRDTAALVYGRLLACPNCHARLPVKEETNGRKADNKMETVEEIARSCGACGSALPAIARALLETEADEPWRCFACGHSHPVREAAGNYRPLPRQIGKRTANSNYRPNEDSNEEEEGVESCARCGLARLPPSCWEPARPWCCVGCTRVNYYLPFCEGCREPAPWFARHLHQFAPQDSIKSQLYRRGSFPTMLNYQSILGKEKEEYCALCGKAKHATDPTPYCARCTPHPPQLPPEERKREGKREQTCLSAEGASSRGDFSADWVDNAEGRRLRGSVAASFAGCVGLPMEGNPILVGHRRLPTTASRFQDLESHGEKCRIAGETQQGGLIDKG